MIDITQNTTYAFKEYEFVNYTQLTKEESLAVLELRNRAEIRKLMINSDIISVESHINFIASLNNRDDMYYWAVKKDNIMHGYVSIRNIDRVNNICELGLLFADSILRDLAKVLTFFRVAYDYTFNFLKIGRIDNFIHKANRFSYAVHCYLGFTTLFDVSQEDNEFVAITLTQVEFNNETRKEFVIKDLVKLIQNKTTKL